MNQDRRHSQLIEAAKLRFRRGANGGAALGMGNAFYAMGQWLVLFSIARATDAETVGQYALCLAVTAPVFLLAGLSLRTVALTHADNRFALSNFIAARLLVSIAAFLLVAGCSIAVDRSLGIVLTCVALAKTLDSVGDIYFVPLQAAGRLLPIGIAMAANGVLTFVFMTAIISKTGSLEQAVAGSVLASALSSILVPMFALRRGVRRLGGSFKEHNLAPDWSAGRIASVIHLALPLGVASAVVSLGTNVPRYVLQGNTSGESLGVFAVVASVVSVAGVVAGSSAQALLPEMTALVRAGRYHRLRAIVHRAMAATALAVAPLIITSVFLARPVLDQVLGEVYGDNWLAFTLALVALMLSAMTFVLDLSLSALRMYNWQLATSITVLVITALASFAAIPTFGITGAAVVLCIEMFARAGLKFAMFERHTAGSQSSGTHRLATSARPLP